MDLDLNFCVSLLSIVIIDLVLAGDNAVVIAMAVKNLRGRTRTWGIALGASGAVVVRVAATFLVAQLLALSFVKLVGGAVILWIAVKLLVESDKQEEHMTAGSFWQALWLIIVADMSMGIDNMLAVGAACGGSLFLLIFGLGLSIPFVVFMSSLLAKLMDRFPIIIYIGAAILGKVGGEMMITDPIVHNWLEPGKLVEYGVMAFFTVAVVAAGRILVGKRKTAEGAPAAAQDLSVQQSPPVINEA
jgi:YjbE family integral membrane protein